MTGRTLQSWIAEHGPLGSHEAAIVASACASRLLMASLARRHWPIRDLDLDHIVRNAGGQWQWEPGRPPGGDGHVTERDVVVAIGRVMYEALVGHPGAGVPAGTPLRRHRPDLPQSFDALVGRALDGDVSLVALAVQLRGYIGARPSRLHMPRSMGWALGVALLLSVLAAAAYRTSGSGGPAVDATPADWEAVHGLTWMDEQSTAAVFVEAALLRENLDAGPDSARTWWTRTWYAWLKQHVDDYLTAEQYGRLSLGRLNVLFGATHPLTQATSVVHERTLRHRGAVVEATSLGDRLVRAHVERSGIGVGVRSASSETTTDGFDRDRDGDGLSDGLERRLGTGPDIPARAGEMWAGRPVRSLAVPLSPAHVVAHQTGTRPFDEGFVSAPEDERSGWLHIMPSVQRGFAERYGWVLVIVGGSPACVVELDTGSPTRRLRVPSAGPSSVQVVDFDAPTRTLHWWTQGGTASVSSFDDLRPSGPGPYGLKLNGPDVAGCPSVSWILRAASIAPM